MIKKLMSMVLVFLMLFIMVGCMANISKVGTGAQGSEMLQERQWYVLWGLVPINNVDSNAMAAGAENYTLKTEQSALDVIINIFTSYVSVVSRTVTVTK